MKVADKPALKVAVTGPNGWIAKALLKKLESCSIETLAIRRDWLISESTSNESESLQLVAALRSCSTVVHLAALVHQMATAPSIDDYRQVNCDLTLQLATASAKAGVKQFIFVSTAKVMGERSVQPFKETDTPAPVDPYSISKLEAEFGLQKLQKSGQLGNMKIVIVRPPLVYGEGVGANFAKLTALAQSPFPLPLGGATALRSMVSIDHLTDNFVALIHANLVLEDFEIFFAADLVDQSTASIIQSIRAKNGRAAGLFTVSPTLMRYALSVSGQKGVYERLFTSLQVDATRLNGITSYLSA
jgi:nucleoside-diphosphate-sugar epimerase